MAATLSQAIAAATSARMRSPAAWASADAALGGNAATTFDTATALPGSLWDLAIKVIDRVRIAVGGIRSTAETPSHARWRAEVDPIVDMVARIDGGSTGDTTDDALRARIEAAKETASTGAKDLLTELAKVIPREPSFDDGGVKSVTELANALEEARLFFGT